MAVDEFLAHAPPALAGASQDADPHQFHLNRLEFEELQRRELCEARDALGSMARRAGRGAGGLRWAASQRLGFCAPEPGVAIPPAVTSSAAPSCRRGALHTATAVESGFEYRLR